MLYCSIMQSRSPVAPGACKRQQVGLRYIIRCSVLQVIFVFKIYITFLCELYMHVYIFAICFLKQHNLMCPETFTRIWRPTSLQFFGPSILHFSKVLARTCHEIPIRCTILTIFFLNIRAIIIFSSSKSNELTVFPIIGESSHTWAATLNRPQQFCC